FHDPATSDTYPLSLHDALPISVPRAAERGVYARLADERPVEPEVLPRLARHGVVEDAEPRAVHCVHADEERGVAARLEERGVRKDRKSTRLNSSHVAISYAVFC